MADYNIQMSYFNSEGTYDNLYPYTIFDNISNIPEYNFGKTEFITSSSAQNNSNALILSVSGVIDWNKYKMIIAYYYIKSSTSDNNNFNIKGKYSSYGYEIYAMNPEISINSNNMGKAGVVCFLCNYDKNNLVQYIMFPLGIYKRGGPTTEERDIFANINSFDLDSNNLGGIRTGSYIRVFGIL